MRNMHRRERRLRTKREVGHDEHRVEETRNVVRSLRKRRSKQEIDREDETSLSSSPSSPMEDSERFADTDTSYSRLRRSLRKRTQRKMTELDDGDDDDDDDYVGASRGGRKEREALEKEPAEEEGIEEDEENEEEDEENRDEETTEDDSEMEALVKKIAIPHFTLPTRGQGKIWFCLGMDLAKYVGVAKSFPLFIQYPQLKKYTANEEEKERLYELGFLPVQLRRKTKTVMARLKNVLETVGKDHDLFDKNRMSRSMTDEDESDTEGYGTPQESMIANMARHKYASYLSNFQRFRDASSHRGSISATAKDTKWIYYSARSAMDFNRYLNEERRNRKFQFYDMHTNVYQVPQTAYSALEILYDRPVDEYPIALYPGQMQHYLPVHRDRFPIRAHPDPPSYTMPLRPANVLPTSTSLYSEKDHARLHHEPYSVSAISSRSSLSITPSFTTS
jgi:hypothetical protein